MESYIVRVLRRQQTQKDSSMLLDGVVEMVDSGKRQVFHSPDELWSILLGAEGTETSTDQDD